VVRGASAQQTLRTSCAVEVRGVGRRGGSHGGIGREGRGAWALMAGARVWVTATCGSERSRCSGRGRAMGVRSRAGLSRWRPVKRSWARESWDVVWGRWHRQRSNP
jgi:hypothetical protein